MKIGRLVIQWLRRPDKTKPVVKSIYKGIICDVCGKRVIAGKKAEHFMLQHSEYRFHIEHRNMSSCLTYVCDICNRTIPGVTSIPKHYHEYHQGVLNAKLQ